MRAIFMTANLQALYTVYPEEIRRQLEQELELLEPITTLDVLPERKDELQNVIVIFSTWGMFHLTKEQIATYFPQVRAVFYGAGSVQGFAREFLESNIAVSSACAANAVPVAEYTTAQIVLANKGYFQRIHHIPNAQWTNRGNGGSVPGNYHTKVGIIGAGMIGKLVISMLKPYTLTVLVFDPFLSEETATELGVTKVSLETLFKECNVISNHLANNPQTIGMLNLTLFSKMKPNAVFINTGRGAQVVEEDLVMALKEEPNRFALLDVTNPEPPLENSPLYQLPNVFLSPHIAGSLGTEVQRMGEYMLEEYHAFVEKRPLRYTVTLKMLETMA